MELSESVRNRRSIRRFLPKPVEEKLVRGLIEGAIWAPSWGNTQPVEIFIATGPRLESFKRENRDSFLGGKKPEPDVSFPETWPDRQDKRYKSVGRSVLNALSIDRKDMESRFEYYGHMFSVFDAPVLLISTIDRALAVEYAMLDIGLLLQSFCLLAHDKGLGTCILAASVYYPELLRKYFSIPETKRIIMGVALGWPDWNNPVNGFERDRAKMEESVKWVC